jgi:hypothetical protein
MTPIGALQLPLVPAGARWYLFAIEALLSMTGIEYRRHIERVGFTVLDAARFFGVGERAGRRWATDGPPDAVAKFLRLMDALQLTADRVRQLLGESGR